MENSKYTKTMGEYHISKLFVGSLKPCINDHIFEAADIPVVQLFLCSVFQLFFFTSFQFFFFNGKNNEAFFAVGTEH